MQAILSDPRLIFLFSGHMIDQPGRTSARFPPECEPRVADEIEAKLAEFGAAPKDLGITQGACGGDLLFAEAMLKRGAAVQLYLPLAEETFVKESVDFTKAPSRLPDRWRDRFFAVRHHPSVSTAVLGESAAPSDVFERCNLWMLERALSFGAAKVRFICVWNGEGGDGPGGTEHMRKAVQMSGGQECWIDTRRLCAQS